MSFDGSNVRFTFGIPRGQDGINGANGTNGSDGLNGSDSAQLSAATSNNTNSVSILHTGFSDPPTLADLEALRQKLNEMILNERRGKAPQLTFSCLCLFLWL